MVSVGLGLMFYFIEHILVSELVQLIEIRCSCLGTCNMQNDYFNNVLFIKFSSSVNFFNRSVSVLLPEGDLIRDNVDKNVIVGWT